LGRSMARSRVRNTPGSSRLVLLWPSMMHGSATGTIVDEARKRVAVKWHFLALFGRFWRRFECHFMVRRSRRRRSQTLNSLWFTSITLTARGYPSECQNGCGRRTHGNGAKNSKRGSARSGARAAGRGRHKCFFAVSACDPSTSWLPLFKRRDGDGTIVDQVGCALSLNDTYTIYGLLRISLMHLRRRAPGT
jgi:hypothetical protein